MRSSAEAGAGVVIVAAGSGRRMGGAVPKQYLDVAGEPVLLRAVRAFALHAGIRSLVIVLPPADVAEPPEWLLPFGARIVAGGAERGDSVRRGLAALPAEADPVLIHDGARPFVDRDTIERVLVGAATGATIAGLPVRDTLKQTDGNGRVLGTLDRDGVWQAQTPQGFPRAVIEEVHDRAAREAVASTDDAALCERFGFTVRVVLGAPENIKITSAADLPLAVVLAARADAATPPARS